MLVSELYVKLPGHYNPLLFCPLALCTQFRLRRIDLFFTGTIMDELLIRWYVPHLTKLPREHKFTLGDR
jgi:hypothetical protein